MSHDSKERPLMNSTTLSSERILSLLDRLDPSVDEPCTVAGCVHHSGVADPLHDVVAGRVAA
jgi:hypothetical protein